MRFVGGDGFWESATAAFSHPQPTLGEPRRRQERNIFVVFRDPKPTRCAMKPFAFIHRPAGALHAGDPRENRSACDK